MQLQWQQPQSCCWNCATFISWTYFLYFLYFMLILPEVVSNLCVRAREGWTEYGFVIGCNSMIVSWLFCFVLFSWFFYTMWSSSSCSIAIAWQESSLFVCVLAVVGILLPTVTASVYCCIWFSLQQSFCFLFLFFFLLFCVHVWGQKRENRRRKRDGNRRKCSLWNLQIEYAL